MARFIIKGGRALKGEIHIRGNKNHALKVFPASLLFSSPVVIKNVPQIEDVFRSYDLLRGLGCDVKEVRGRSITITPPTQIEKRELHYDIAKRIRASILFVGPLLARAKKVRFPYPGGCVIGKRPIDLFLDGWRAMGASVRKFSDGLELTVRALHGTDYTFRKVSHTGTEGLMLTAVLAQGRTTLRNAALEPEVVALANFLNAGGARIRGAGTPTIVIEGTRGQLLRGAGCTIMPDRGEAGSMLILGSLLGQDMYIKNCVPEHLAILLAHLRFAGVHIEEGKDWLRVRRPKRISPVDVKTREYPGFATDHQAPFTVFLTQARGQSFVFETLFDGRLQYVEDLNRMGANIVPCDQHRVLVSGPTPLRGREMESLDLRAGLAFVIAALVARGTSYIENVYQIDRGYERIDERLRALGAHIKRIP